MKSFCNIMVAGYVINIRCVTIGSRHFGVIDVFLNDEQFFRSQDAKRLSDYCIREGFFDGCYSIQYDVYDTNCNRLKFDVCSERYK